jgi:two-component system, cell cycle response regulator DivK
MGTKEPLSTTPLGSSPANTEEESGSSFLVMVVDDSIDNLTAISLGLQQNGYRVVTASNGEEALKIAPQVLPDVILMDLAMPGIDGLESTRRIREDAELRDVPVIALTAFSTGGFRRAAYDTGFDGYLTKPVEFDRLHDLIRRLLALARSRKNPAASGEQASKPQQDQRGD